MTASEIALRHEVDDLPLWRDPQAYAVLKETLECHGVDEEIFARLVAVYRENAHKQKIHTTVGFDEIFQSIGEGI